MTDRIEIAFSTLLWKCRGDSSWHFVTLPAAESDMIKSFLGRKRRGWGSIRVVAVIGETSWKTSIFPDSREGAYILPVKAEIRKGEKIRDGDEVSVHLTIEV